MADHAKLIADARHYVSYTYMPAGARKALEALATALEQAVDESECARQSEGELGMACADLDIRIEELEARAQAAEARERVMREALEPFAEAWCLRGTAWENAPEGYKKAGRRGALQAMASPEAFRRASQALSHLGGEEEQRPEQAVRGDGLHIPSSPDNGSPAG